MIRLGAPTRSLGSWTPKGPTSEGLECAGRAGPPRRGPGVAGTARRRNVPTCRMRAEQRAAGRGRATRRAPRVQHPQRRLPPAPVLLPYRTAWLWDPGLSGLPSPRSAPRSAPRPAGGGTVEPPFGKYPGYPVEGARGGDAILHFWTRVKRQHGDASRSEDNFQNCGVCVSPRVGSSPKNRKYPSTYMTFLPSLSTSHQRLGLPSLPFQRLLHQTSGHQGLEGR